jgi:hypothetical protein
MMFGKRTVPCHTANWCDIRAAGETLMDDKPMLNSPIETGVDAGEEFTQSKIGRLDRLRAEMNVKGMAALPEAELERIEQFKRGVIGRISELTGLTFDADGRCTNPEKFRMDAEFKEKWAQVCQEFGTEDPQKGEQLLRQAGSLLRGAAGTPEVKPTDKVAGI